jgi:hypothetical protein
MKHFGEVMSLALALAMTGGMAPQASAKTPPQMQGTQMTHKASKGHRAYSAKRSKNRTVSKKTPTVMPGMRKGSL